jgi:hypothetical protein
VTPDWQAIFQALTIVLLGTIARGIYKGVRQLNRTFRRYGERLTDLEDWNHQNDPGWKSSLTRRRNPGEDKD